MSAPRWLQFFKLRWLGRSRVSAYGLILLLGSVLSLFWVYREAMGPAGSDFLAFWSAAQVLGQGDVAHVYDPVALRAAQATVGRHDVFAFVSPPPMLLVIWPLQWLSYPAAWAVWIAATYGLWFVATRPLFPALASPIAAFPGALLAAWHAQTGFLTSAVQARAAQLLAERPFRAGLWVGALVVKPHLALLFPVAFVAGRHWRAVGGAALSALGLIVAAWAVFGTATMLAYRQAWHVSDILMRTGNDTFFLRQATVYAMARVAFDPAIAVVAQATASLAAAAITWRAFSGIGPLAGKLALLFAATPLATPYLFSYDLPFLIMPIAWLAQQLRADDLGGWSRPAVLGLYLSPLVTRAMALPLGINPMPLVSMMMVWLVWRRLAADSRDVRSGDSRPLPSTAPTTG